MANEIKNILVPVDFSKDNSNFLNVAAAIARRHSAKIHLLNVVKSNVLSSGSALAGKFYYHGNSLIESSQEQLEKEKERFRQQKRLQIETQSCVGTVSTCVSDYAAENKIDLVVLGVDYPKKRPGFISSNTYEIISNSDIPVMTIPFGFTKSKFTRLLYPVRDTEGVMAKLETVLPIAQKNNAEVRIVGLAEGKMKNSAVTVNNALKILKVKLKKQNVKFQDEEMVNTKNPEQEILQACDQCGSDLVAVNVSEDQLATKLFTNNFTENMIYKSKIPVLYYKKEHAAV